MCHFVSWVVIRKERQAHRWVEPLGMFYGMLNCQQSILDPAIATYRRVQTLPGYCLHSPRGSNWGSLGVATLFSARGGIATRMTAATLMLPLLDTMLRVCLLPAFVLPIVAVALR